MPFSIEEFAELLRLLEERPEWRGALRQQLLTAELLAVPDTLRQIAELQARTEARLAELAGRVEELAGAQARTEARLEELAGAQARTEARLAELAGRVEELAGAQARTEARLDELAAAQARTEARLAELAGRVDVLDGRLRRVQQQVGGLAELVGASAELEGERALLARLSAGGYTVLAALGPLDVDGEVDVAVPVEDPAGRRFWVLLEARARLRRGDVAGWDRRLRDPKFLAALRSRGVEAALLPYAFGLRIYADAEALGRARGIGILGPLGERVAPAPRPA